MSAPNRTRIPFDSAQALIRSQVQPLEAEEVALADAGLRVLAAPVIAKVDAPRFDVAAMDGYAVDGGALGRGDVPLRLGGASYAGHALALMDSEATAIRIMTGAPMPSLKDRVIPLELVEVWSDSARLVAPLPVMSHVRALGSIFRRGQELLPNGVVLDPGHLVLAAAADQPTVLVHRRPRLCIVASGDELTAPGSAAGTEMQIPDSLSLPIRLLGQMWGAQTIATVQARDDGAQIRAAVADCRADVVVMVGGAAIGDRDLARSALSPLGLEVYFAGAAIKPGKPVWYGRLGSAHVLGLPGNPAAAMVVARLFLAPLLCALSGRGFDAALSWHPLTLIDPVLADDEREMFLFGRRHYDGVEIIPRQSAAAQLPLLSADLLVRLPAGSAPAPNGPVSVLELW